MDFSRRLFLTTAPLALAACASPRFAPVLGGPPSTAHVEDIFVATTRARRADGWFSADRADRVHYLTARVNFPAGYQAGDRARIKEIPDPARDFSVAPPEMFGGEGDFAAAIKSRLAALPAGERNLTLYVHGFYNAFFDSLFRAAQLKRDFDLGGVMLHFAWPSLGNNTGYAYDRESVLYSRDAMESVLRMAASAGAEKLTIIGHSLGAMLVMEVLRQIEIGAPGWTHQNIGGLAFVSPDIDLGVFKSQAARIKRMPEDFVIFVSDRDKVLWVSSTLNGVKRRLGNTRDLDISTEGNLTIVDLSDLAKSAKSGHFIPGTSSAAIKFLADSSSFLRLFPRQSLLRQLGQGTRVYEPITKPAN